MKKIFFLLLISFLSFQCTQESKTVKPQGLVVDNAMVVSARKEASEIGIEILKKGGNAFDAMIATDLALAVAYPFAGNIGGGGFMVYRTNDGKTGTLDYREKAPMLASRNMYLDENGNVISGKSTKGALAIGIPGTIAGLFEVHQKFGSLPFKELIQPAIDLAKKGIIVTEKQERRLAHYQEPFREINGKDIFLNKSFKANDIIKFPELATSFCPVSPL